MVVLTLLLVLLLTCCSQLPTGIHAAASTGAPAAASVAPASSSSSSSSSGSSGSAAKTKAQKGHGDPASAAASAAVSFGRRVVDAAAHMPTAAAAAMGLGAEAAAPGVVDVAIVGGGIGGLATALAFKRLTNITAHVFERSPTLRGGEGTALTMWPNGLAALGAIDPLLLKRVKAAGSVIRRQTFTTPHDSLTEDTGVFESRFGEPLLSVFWKTLHAQLAEAVGKEMVSLGKTCVALESLPDDEEAEAENKGRVLLRFDDGSEVRANCVLAADGVHSVLRQRFVGDGKPRDHGRLIYRSVVPHAACPHADRDQMLGKINDDPSKLIHWQPCGAGNTYWAVIKKPREDGELLVRRDKNPEAMKRWLLEEYADFPEVLPFIAATPAAAILERPVVDRAPIETWGFLDGRVLLIGDAAHAMILSVGQGANTALEDAVYIASYLRDALALFPPKTGGKGQAIEAAFRAFQDVRVPHCTAIQTESEAYAKNAYGAPKGITPAAEGAPLKKAAAATAKGCEGEEEGGRKLGGYRLVQFSLVPFEDVYFQHTAAAASAAAAKSAAAGGGGASKAEAGAGGAKAGRGKGGADDGTMRVPTGASAAVRGGASAGAGAGKGWLEE